MFRKHCTICCLILSGSAVPSGISVPFTLSALRKSQPRLSERAGTHQALRGHLLSEVQLHIPSLAPKWAVPVLCHRYIGWVSNALHCTDVASIYRLLFSWLVSTCKYDWSQLQVRFMVFFMLNFDVSYSEWSHQVSYKDFHKFTDELLIYYYLGICLSFFHTVLISQIR